MTTGESANATFTVTLSPSSTERITVEYATSSQTAIAGMDYTATAGTLTFEPNTTTQMFTVLVTGDALDEVNETFTVTLSNAQNATLSNATATGTITDDDATPSLSIADASVTEGTGSSTEATFTVTLSAASGQRVTVEYATSSGTGTSDATAGTDYTPTAGTLTFEPGMTEQTIAVPITGDALDETNETFTITLSNAQNATLSNATATGTITDDDMAGVTVNRTAITIPEGLPHGVAVETYTYTLKLNSQPTGDVTITISSDNTKVVATPSTLTFTTITWDRIQEVSVIQRIHDDDAMDETATLTHAVSGADYAMVTVPNVTVTVEDRNAPKVVISKMSLDVREGGNGFYGISLGTPPIGGNVVLNISSDNSDVTVNPSTLTFDSVNGRTVRVVAAHDDDAMDETATLTHTVSGSSTNYAMVTAPSVVVNVDDDESTSVIITPTTLTMDEGTTATYAVKLNEQPTGDVTVEANIRNSTGPIEINPTTLTFKPIDWNIAQTVTVSAGADADFNTAIFLIQHTVTGLPGATTAPDVTGEVTDTGSGTPGVIVNTTRVVLDEGGSQTYSLLLTTRPASDVTVTVSKTGDNDITVTPAMQTIDHSTYIIGQPIMFTVNSAQDDDSTPDEATLSHAITGANYGSVTVPNVTVFVDDDEGQSHLHISSGSGSEVPSPVTFTVRLQPAATNQVTVNYATSDGTATVGKDYTATSGTLTFDPGTTAQTITVPIIDDDLCENDETFTVTLSNPSGATISTASATGTIVDNDPLPFVYVFQPVGAIQENKGPMVITFIITEPSEKEITVDYATSDGTATAGTDYTATSGTATFAPGEVQKQVEVTLSNDMIEEGEETFTVAISNPVNAILIATRASFIARIIDPIDTFDWQTVAESSHLIVSLSVRGFGSRRIIFYWTNTPGTATTEDYGVTSGQTTIPAYSRSANLVIPIIDDNLPEGEETFTLRFTNVEYRGVFQPYPDQTGRRVTIQASDPVGVSVSGATTVNEGTSTTYTVNLSPAPTDVLTVEYATSDGTATAGTDYTAASGTLTFNAGETSKTITVQTTMDDADENRETFSFTLSNAMGGGGPTPTIGASVTTAIIDNDDPPALRIADASVTEGNSGSTNAIFTVTLSAASAHQIAVDYATSDGTATAGTDYTATSGTLTFNAGETSKTITVPVTGDTNDEPAEIFTVRLSNPSFAVLPAPTAMGTITDDDGQPSVTLVLTPSSINESGGVSTVTATLSGQSSATTTVTVDATAISPAVAEDFTLSTNKVLTIAAGATTSTGVVTITAVNNNVDTPNKQVRVSATAQNDIGVTAPSDQTLTITDDDGQPSVTLVLTPSSINESGGVSTVTATLSGQSSATTTVTVDATAISPAVAEDFTLSTNKVLTIAAGATTSTEVVTITAVNNNVDTPNKQVRVSATAQNDIGVTAPSDQTLTITDDDETPEDDPPVLSIADQSVMEDAGTLAFTVTLDTSSDQNVTLVYVTSDGSATAGNDYTANSGRLIFASGEVTKSITVAILDDKLDEPDETFTVTLSNPSNVILGDDAATGTIIDDDASPELSIADQSVMEDGGAMVFTVTLDAISGKEVMVAYATSDGSATAGEDYTANNGTLTFAPGDMTKSITVAILDDILDEPDETFTVTLSNPSNAILGDDAATGTIIDDDALPVLSIADQSVMEDGDAMVFTVALDAISGKSVTVNYTTSDGSATAGEDYTANSGTLTFAPGDMTKSITVAVLDDILDEPDETFTVTLSNPSNATLNDDVATGTIIDDDAPPELSIADQSVMEDGGAMVFTVTLDAISGKSVTVNYATSDGSATAGRDYTATSGTVTFAPGDVTKSITVAVLDDKLDEPDETFTVTLSNPSNAILGDDTATGTIIDDDASPVLSIADQSRIEDGGTMAFTVTLDAISGKSVTVNYATSDGSATAGRDYTATSGTLTFVPGDMTKSITVAVLDDKLDEPDETFTVTLSNPSNAILGDDVATGTIIDDDASPELSIADQSVMEDGDALVFTVMLDAISGKSVTVNYATSDGRATAGRDYTANSGTLTFAPGDMTKTITVAVLDDKLDEPDETFTVTLSNPSNAILGDDVATGTIIDDDAPPELSIADQSVMEDGDALVFTVMLDAISGKSITVTYATSDGRATAGRDYTANSGTLTFAPGDMTKTITVAVLDDKLDEPDETFTVTLSNPSNATLNDDTATGAIIDDDASPELSIADQSVMEDGDAMVFTVALDAISGKSITVTYATSDGSATAGRDYTATSGTLTFVPGDMTKTITVAVLDDRLDEPDETFTVTLSNPSNATLNDDTATGTIADNDAPPELSIADQSVMEDGGALVFTVTLNAISGKTVTVNYATSDGRATAGRDYTANSGRLTFAPGDVTKSITVAVLDDKLDEPDETFTVTLSNPSNATLNDDVATGTIIDDDASPELSIADQSVMEDGDAMVFTVALDAISGKEVMVAYTTSDGSATAGNDYTANSGTLTFAPGDVTKSITVAVLDDRLDEPDETFTVTLSNPSNATLNDDTGIGTIEDNDIVSSTIILSLDPAQVNEDSGTTSIEVSAAFPTGSAARIIDTVVTLNVTGNTATGGGIDFADVAMPLVVTIPAEQTHSTTPVRFDLTVIDDSMDEHDETLTVSGTAEGFTLSDKTLTLVDNDAAPVLSMASMTVAENAGTMTLVITLSAVSGKEVIVECETADGTATAGEDYIVMDETLIYAPGDTAHTITVTVIDDMIDEPDETFHVTLSNPSNASMGRVGTGTIIDDDIAGLTIDPTTLTIDEGGTEMYTLTLDTQPLGEVTIAIGSNNADVAVDQSTLAFTPKNWHMAQEVKVSALEDDDNDNDAAILTHAITGYGSLTEGGTVTVMVPDNDAARTALKLSLAAFARLIGGDAVEMITSRVRQTAWGASQLTVYGHRVVLDGTGVAYPVGMRHNMMGNWITSHHVLPADLLARSMFNVRLTESATNGDRPIWHLWGQGLRNDFTHGSINGLTTAGYLGMDVYLKSKILLGLALSHTTGVLDYAVGDITGTIDLRLTSLLPYIGYLPRSGLSVWGLFGLGQGNANLLDLGDETPISMWLFAGGGRNAMWTSGALDVATKADGFLVSMESDVQAGHLLETRAEVQRLRLALEGRTRWRLSEASHWGLNLELGTRWDGGDGETGLGAEVSGGIAYHHVRLGLRMETRGRYLLAHQASNMEEWSASMRLAIDPGGDGQGLWLVVSPTYGAPFESSAERMWRTNQMFSGPGGARAGGMGLDVGYGQRLFGALLTTYGGLSIEEHARYRVGNRLMLETSQSLGTGLNLELARQAYPAHPASHAITFRGQLYW